MLKITLEHPVQEDLRLLHQRHTEAMHANSPPESIHMLPANALAEPDVRFYVLREDGEAIGMAALKHLDAGHAEIKSMHVLHEHRGRGLARLLADHLLAEARKQGLVRLSLETGSHPAFAAAHGLYSAIGFEVSEPFAEYELDPNSVYMTLHL